MRLVRRPHTTPTCHWRRSATTAQTRGRQHTKTRPIRGCTPPSSVEYGRWHDPCPPPFQPWAVARYSDASVQAVSGTAQADIASLSDAEYAIPSFRGPTCSARTRYSSAVDGEVAFGVALDGPTPHEGILALQRGEDVKGGKSSSRVLGRDGVSCTVCVGCASRD